MSTILMVVVAVVVIALVAAAGYALWTQARTRKLRRRFGPEYDRAVERHGDRGTAERELLSRERRHHDLELRELDPRQRELYREQWVHVQEQFVDTPGSAVEQADRLVTVVMGERGYPTRDFDDRVAHLSVEHGRTLDHYRRGHDISGRAARQEATTEELRQAMVHYRALFEDLLHVPDGERSGTAATPRASARHGREPEAGR
jgi:FtsZ-interacting cell division protein ZipA